MTDNKNLQTDLLESLSTFIGRSEIMSGKFNEYMSHKKIIISSDFIPEVLKEDRGVTKTPVTWPLIDYKMFYNVSVPAGSKLPKHSHDESVFRMLISGSLIINGHLIKDPGIWYVVPAFTEYEISTDTGYSVLSAYTSNCRTGRQQATLDKNLSPMG